MKRERKELEPKIKGKSTTYIIRPLTGHRPTAAFLAALRAVVAMGQKQA